MGVLQVTSIFLKNILINIYIKWNISKINLKKKNRRHGLFYDKVFRMFSKKKIEKKIIVATLSSIYVFKMRFLHH